MFAVRKVSGVAAPEIQRALVFVPNKLRVGRAGVVHTRQHKADSTRVPSGKFMGKEFLEKKLVFRDSS